MTAQSLTADASHLIDGYLNDLFREDADVHEAADLNRRADAFSALARCYLERDKVWCYREQDLRIDGHAVRLMLGRFQRDAFGVGRFFAHLDQLVASGKISKEVAPELRRKVMSLGLRVASDDPRKTRIAAVFSLWMCALRPVSVEFHGDPAKDGQAHKFCAALNYWIASTYLRKFGRVSLGNQNNGPELMKRILHDFTFREVNLSSLEILYCGIFHPRVVERSVAPTTV